MCSSREERQARATALVIDLRKAGISEKDIRELWIPADLAIPERTIDVAE